MAKSKDFFWQDNKLCLAGRFVGAKIVPDANWPKMFRVEYPKDVLSDMVNLTRARDAAITLVAADLNRRAHDESPAPESHSSAG